MYNRPLQLLTTLILLLFFVSGCDKKEVRLTPVPAADYYLMVLSKQDSSTEDVWQDLPDSVFTLINAAEGLIFYSELGAGALPTFDLEDLCIRQDVELKLFQDSILVDDLTVSFKETEGRRFSLGKHSV